ALLCPHPVAPCKKALDREGFGDEFRIILISRRMGNGRSWSGQTLIVSVPTAVSRMYEHCDRDNRGICKQGIRARFRDGYRDGFRAAGFERRDRSADFQEEKGAGVPARMAAQGLSLLADDERAGLAKCPLPEDRFS